MTVTAEFAAGDIQGAITGATTATTAGVADPARGWPATPALA